MQEDYKVLNLDENATDSEVDEAYKRLKRKYSEERFMEGDIGNQAAKKLTAVENAYAEIIRERNSTHKTESGEPVDLSAIELLIKQGNISEAQTKLDEISDRSAEWHYLQSVVFYKKNWINESKKQLEIAMNMEPYTSKYADAYTKLKQKTEFNEQRFHSGNANYGNPNSNFNNGNPNDRQMGGNGINDCLSFCVTWCCMDMLCSVCCR